jgi:hypothetical protein
MRQKKLCDAIFRRSRQNGAVDNKADKVRIFAAADNGAVLN